MPNITDSVSSAFDVATQVSKEIAKQKSRKLDPLMQDAKKYETLISAYGSLQSALSIYQTSLNKLKQASLHAHKTNITNKGTGGALTSNAFTANINDDDISKPVPQKLRSAGFSSSQTFKAGDSLIISLGSSLPVVVTLTSDSNLRQVANAINNAKANVTANIDTDAQGQQHLSLTANTGGSNNTIQIYASGSLASFAYPVAGSSTFTQIQAASDAPTMTTGGYAIAISQLAQTQKLKSTGFAPGATFNSGFLSIQVGDSLPQVIQPLNHTLAGVRDAINNAHIGATASIMVEGGLEYLTIATKETGAANSLRITGGVDFAPFAFDAASPGSSQMQQIQEPQDAQFTIDGVHFTSASNNVRDVLPGITLELLQATTTSDRFQLTIDNDESGIQAVAADFVTAYNTLVQAINSLTAAQPGIQAGDPGTAEPLAHELFVKNILDQLSHILIQPINGNTNIRILSSIGINYQKDGTLALDREKLTNATKNHFDEVAQLFIADNGIVNQLNTVLTSLLKDDGPLALKTKSLQDSLSLNQHRQAEEQKRLANLQMSYMNQFNMLKASLVKAQTIGNLINQQLGQLAH